MEQCQLAALALEAFGLAGATLQFLRHNENAVYQVRQDGQEDLWILRLHIPAAHIAAASVPRRLDWIESEIRFLSALSIQSDIPVQTPRYTRAGSPVFTLPESLGYATVLSFLPGEALRQDPPDAAAHAYAAGNLAARLHTFAGATPEMAGWPRPAYNAHRVRRALEAIASGIDLGLFDATAFSLMEQGAAHIAAIMDRAQATPGAWGLIHADLGLGNLILHPDGRTLSPIDFSLCGPGPFLMDVGGLMGAYDSPPLRRAVLEGYAALRPLREADYRSVEAMFLLGIYLFMSMHLRNEAVREWFFRRLPIVLRDYISPFAQGEPFLPTLL